MLSHTLRQSSHTAMAAAFSPASRKMASTTAASAGNFGHAKTGNFWLEAPQLRNPYREDPIMDRLLRRWLPQSDYDRVAADLDRFGERVVSEINDLGLAAGAEEPRLQQFDAWGRRVDNLWTCDAWKRLKAICAEEGIINIGYDESVDPETRRLHQLSKLFLFSPSAGLSTCPMAMTDGAAKTIKEMGLIGKHKEATEAYHNLTSRDPTAAWTSGQWMTEKRGGSDVGGACDTHAVHLEGDQYLLYGYKWFSSAIDADVALTLARVVNKDGNAEEGSKGLSLFLVKVRNPETGRLNGIEMVKLKDKLGTRQLPTAELLIEGCRATRLSDSGRGIPSIANMLNVTRVHNAAASTSAMRRIVQLARDYAKRRQAFGRTIADWPLHTATLAKLEVEARACELLYFESGRLLGRTEAGRADDTEAVMLRLVTPIVKLYTAKTCMPHLSEGIEAFGGQGYIEETGIPTLFRDSQVTPIWEGTTNVLALDVLRVFAGKHDVLTVFRRRVAQLIEPAAKTESLKEAADAVQKATNQLSKLLATLSDAALKDTIRVDAGARQLAMSLGRIYSAALLVDLAAHTAQPTDVEAARRFSLEQQLVDAQLPYFHNDRIAADRALLYQNFTATAKL